MKKYLISYTLILCFILSIFAMFRPFNEEIRYFFIAKIAPIWETTTQIKQRIWNDFLHFKKKTPPPSSDYVVEESSLGQKEITQEENLQYLTLENQLQQQHILRLIEKISNPNTSKDPLIKRRALAARVIFRSLNLWNHFVWIDKGTADNPLYSDPILNKNSPVLMGDSLIGVIEFAGKHYSKVRLITDQKFTPSVRVKRHEHSTELILQTLEPLIQRLALFESDLPNDQKKILSNLEKFKESILKTINQTPALFLAKGELSGAVYKKSHDGSIILKGTGFNYDFPDDKGEARDLRSGKKKKILSSITEEPPIPIIQKNDLLVTTGMDGIFPEDLKVAIVTAVEPLKEGDFFYSIEATPTAGSLDNLSIVFIIPPQLQYPIEWDES